MSSKPTKTAFNAKQKSASSPRRRLSPELRRRQILDAAAQLVVGQGYLPLPIEKLARAAGSSKALIYTYFPTQYDIFNALISREFEALTVAGFETASEVDDLQQAALLCGMIYFERVVQVGPILKILLTDLYMVHKVAVSSRDKLAAVMQRFARLARRDLSLSAKEIPAAVEMLRVIPEEAGGLAYHRQVDVSTMRELCRVLLLSSLQALRAPDRALAIGQDNTV